MASIFDKIKGHIDRGVDRAGMFFNDPDVIRAMSVEQIEPDAPVGDAFKRYGAATLGGPGDIYSLIWKDLIGAESDLPGFRSLPTSETLQKRFGAPQGPEYMAVDFLASDPFSMLGKTIKGARQIIAGPKAKGADLEKLEKAKQLDKQTYIRPETIYHQTGWFKGPDDKWKFEIPDDQFQLTATGQKLLSPKVGGVSKDELTTKGIKSLMILPDGNIFDPYAKASDGTGKVIKNLNVRVTLNKTSDLDQGIAKAEEILNSRRKRGELDLSGADEDLKLLREIKNKGGIKKEEIVSSRPAREVFDMEALYEQYPDLVKDDVSIKRLPVNPYNSIRGYFNPQENLIGIRSDAFKDYDEARSILLHELQHKIQMLEDFGVGGLPQRSAALLKTFQRETRDRTRLTPKESKIQTKKSNDAYRYRQASKLNDLVNLFHVSAPRQIFNTSWWMQNSKKVIDILGMPPKYGERTTYAQKAGRIIAEIEMEELMKKGDLPIIYNDESINTTQELYRIALNNRDDVRRQYRNAAAAYKRSYDNYMKSDIPKKIQTIRAMEDIVENYRPGKEGVFDDMGDFKRYQALAGETEARLVQKRRNLTPEQRAEKPFFQDYDVPIKKQIPITESMIQNQIKKLEAKKGLFD